MTADKTADRRADWREKLRVVIFEADTPAGKAFDVALLIAIVISVSVVMAESVASIRQSYGRELDIAEWIFTLLFTTEYVLRLLSVRRPARYARSFFGIVDLLAIVPTYLSLLFPGAGSMLVIRGLRLLRVFRVFKLGRYLGEARLLTRALVCCVGTNWRGRGFTILALPASSAGPVSQTATRLRLRRLRRQ